MRAMRANPSISEAFEHERLGWFDVTSARALVAQNPPWVLRCESPLTQEITRHVLATRDIDFERVWEILLAPEAPWEEPAITVFEGTDCLIDGNHRLIARALLRCTTFRFCRIPLARAPRVNPEADGFILLPEYGEKDFVRRRTRRT